VRGPRASENSSDTELLQLSSAGNEEAFLILYRRHRGPVFRFALHMSGNRETAEEATQEVFLAMLSDAHQYVAERGPLESYLIGIARNQVRRQLRGARATVSDDRESGATAHSELLENLSKKEELRALHQAILSLPPNYREVVALCDLEGLAYAQVAEQLGCAVGTVRSRLHRARGILEKKLRMRDQFRVREGCPV
jgi:RNA polymerase sigma-70 factor, ECF subfamily